MDLAFNGFEFSSPVDTVSPQRELSWIFPLVALSFSSLVDLYHVSSERTFTDFALSGFFSIFLSPVDLYYVSSEITIMDFALNGLSFSSLVDTVSSQRELSQVLPSVVLILL
jgi:hypothetical protein